MGASSTASIADGYRVRMVVGAGLIGGLALAMALVALIMVQYPPRPTSPPYLAYGGLALALLLALGGWVGWALLRPPPARQPERSHAILVGSQAGLLFGGLWVVEIAYNNLLAPLMPPFNIARVRDPVDDLFWAAIVLSTLTCAAVVAYRAGSIREGVRFGFWSGLVGGLAACITGLLLVAFFIGAPMSDPLVLAEYAQRAGASGAPDLAHYVAYDTMGGGLGHLLALGVVQGILLGALGGSLGKALATRRASSQEAG